MDPRIQANRPTTQEPSRDPSQEQLVRPTELDAYVPLFEQLRRQISRETVQNGAQAYAHHSMVRRIKAYLE